LRLSGVAAKRVVGWDFDEDDPDAVGILDPHLGQAPGLCDRLPQDRDSGGGEAAVLGVDVPHLKPDHHRSPGGTCPASGDFQQPLAEEEDHRWVGRGPELAVDRQAQRIAVEAPAPVQVGGAQQDTAAQDLHSAIIPAAGNVGDQGCGGGDAEDRVRSG